MQECVPPDVSQQSRGQTSQLIKPRAEPIHALVFCDGLLKQPEAVSSNSDRSENIYFLSFVGLPHTSGRQFPSLRNASLSGHLTAGQRSVTCNCSLLMLTQLTWWHGTGVFIDISPVFCHRVAARVEHRVMWGALRKCSRYHLASIKLLLNAWTAMQQWKYTPETGRAVHLYYVTIYLLWNTDHREGWKKQNGAKPCCDQTES